MIFDMGDDAPFQFITIKEADGRIFRIEIPTYVDVVNLPVGLTVCPVEQPLKRSDLCLTAYPLFH